jgi:ADP-heptose:LPS heptosyltransferase
MNILVMRLSAMGDVALTVPVIKGMVEQHPGVKITMVTRRAFAPFFNSLPEVRLFHPDLGMRHKGFRGLHKIYKDLKKLDKFDSVIDLHDVLRTKVVSWFFGRSGIPVHKIDKGRAEKKALISGKSKKILKHTVERYCDVFRDAGLPVTPATGGCFMPRDNTLIKISSFFLFGEHELNIGIAPYAKHPLKMWPEEYMVELLKMISERHTSKFWLFGGFDEMKGLLSFNERCPGAFLVTGKLSLEEELAVMGKLDFMLAMDSSNMHMAALSGTKVVSIWGGTDPMTGFSAWQQPDKYSLRTPVEELECRPCTVYGKGKCKRGDLACMIRLTPEKVYNKLLDFGLI